MGTLKLSRYKLTPDYNPYIQSCRLVHFTYSALSAPNKKYNSYSAPMRQIGNLQNTVVNKT